MKKIVLALAFMFGFSGLAFASQCPSMAAKVEEAMKTATLDDAGKAKVTELLEKGKAAHDSGDHAGAEASLGEALKMLGM